MDLKIIRLVTQCAVEECFNLAFTRGAQCSHGHHYFWFWPMASISVALWLTRVECLINLGDVV